MEGGGSASRGTARGQLRYSLSIKSNTAYKYSAIAIARPSCIEEKGRMEIPICTCPAAQVRFSERQVGTTLTRYLALIARTDSRSRAASIETIDFHRFPPSTLIHDCAVSRACVLKKYASLEN